MIFTFPHGLCTLFYSVYSGVVFNVSIESGAGNQTAFVFQGLVSNTALLLWATGGELLQDGNPFKYLVLPEFCPGWFEEPMGHTHTPS